MGGRRQYHAGEAVVLTSFAALPPSVKPPSPHTIRRWWRDRRWLTPRPAPPRRARIELSDRRVTLHLSRSERHPALADSGVPRSGTPPPAAASSQTPPGVVALRSPHAAMVSAVGFAIGIDLGGTKLRGGLVAADGTVAVVEEHATDTSDAKAIVDQIVAMARKLGEGRDVAGVGVGVPGTVQRPDGTLIQAVNLPLRNIGLRALISAELDAHVALENDGNCAALGEHRFGAAVGTTHSVTLTLGTGVGGGIVADGRLFAGAHGTGGELGHIVIERDGRPCQGSCPGRGHLEAYCSGTALGARGREAGFGDAHDVLVKRATKRDPRRARPARRSAGALGAGLVSLANALAPDVFVIGGGLGDAAAPPDPARRRAILREQALPPNGESRLCPRASATTPG